MFLKRLFFNRLTHEQRVAQAKRAHQEGTAEQLLHRTTAGRYLSDAVYGANDGIITTFAVVSGVAGAALEPKVVLILGFANLLADGLSMAVSNYLGTKSEQEFVQEERKMEEWEIEHLPEEERKEIEEIYYEKGFRGDDLKRVVEVITSDKEIWVKEMLKEELGICQLTSDSPIKHGLATFIAFVAAGLVPLLSFLFPLGKGAFTVSIILTALVLFTVGALRSILIARPWYRAGVEMLLVGAAAAVVAYGVGYLLGQLV